MSTEQQIALLAVCVAVVALTSTVLLGLALRRTRADVHALASQRQTSEPPQESSTEPGAESVPAPVEVTPTTPLPERAAGTGEPHIVTRDGRVVVVPSTEQVVQATMGKPMIRGAVLSHGIRHALRPESRDRLRGMVRREYRRRRRIRLRAGRRAARQATIAPSEAQAWLGSATPNRKTRDDDGGS